MGGYMNKEQFVMTKLESFKSSLYEKDVIEPDKKIKILEDKLTYKIDNDLSKLYKHSAVATNMAKLKVEDTIEFKVAKLKVIIKLIRKFLKEQTILNVKLMPPQAKFVNSPTKISLLLGGNRSGKTFCGAFNTALFALGLHPRYPLPTGHKAVVWVVGLDKVNHVRPILHPTMKQFIPLQYIVSYNKEDDFWTLTNGVRIYFKSGESGESKFQSAAVDFLWIDEEPKKPIWDEVYMRTVDYGAPIFITMTPTNGISWSYDEIFKKTGDGIHSVITANTLDNDYLPKEELERLVENMSEEEKAMRLSGEYVSLGAKKVFKPELTRKMKKTINEPLFKGDIYEGQLVDSELGEMSVWEKYDPKSYYCLGFDTSEGVNDPTALIVLRYDSRENRVSVSATYNKVVNVESLHKIFLWIAGIYNNPLAVIERNSMGVSVIDRIKDFYYGSLYIEERVNDIVGGFSKRVGFHTDRLSKLKLVRDTSELLASRNVVINSLDIVRQFDSYIENKKGTLEASGGHSGHDDLLIAFMLAVQGLFSNQFYFDFKDPFRSSSANWRSSGAYTGKSQSMQKEMRDYFNF